MKLASLTLAAALIAVGTAHAQTAPARKSASGGGEELLKKYGCVKCHASQSELPATPMKAIAAKYKGRPDAVAVLTGVVKDGRPGKDVLSMPPHPQVPEADAKRIVTYILSLGGK